MGGYRWNLGENLSVTQNGNIFVIPYFAGNGLSKSTDGGQSFSSNSISSGGVDFNDIFFTGNDTGYVTTDNGLLRTVDAGINWAAVSTTGLDVGSEYSSLFFYNDNLGWICDSSNVYTTNGNINNWTRATIHTNSSYVYVNAIYPTSASNIYLLASGDVYKSTDGGINFYLKSSIPSYPTNYGGVDIHFIDDNTGYVLFGRRIYKTTDGATTWQVVVALGEHYISEIHFTDASHGWASTNDSGNGILLKYNQ